MIDEINEMPSKQTPGKLHKSPRKYGFEDPANAIAKRKQLLVLLKARYGYTNEKAVDELARLMKQFYIINKSLGTHHARPDFQYPHAK